MTDERPLLLAVIDALDAWLLHRDKRHLAALMQARNALAEWRSTAPPAPKPILASPKNAT
jgi:hypothetical protein